MYPIQKLVFFDKTFGKVSSHKYMVPEIKKIEVTVKLKELDEFGTFFKKYIPFLPSITTVNILANSAPPGGEK